MRFAQPWQQGAISVLTPQKVGRGACWPIGRFAGGKAAVLPGTPLMFVLFLLALTALSPGSGSKCESLLPHSSGNSDVTGSPVAGNGEDESEDGTRALVTCRVGYAGRASGWMWSHIGGKRAVSAVRMMLVMILLALMVLFWSLSRKKANREGRHGTTQYCSTCDVSRHGIAHCSKIPPPD